MEELAEKIYIPYIDQEINSILKSVKSEASSYQKCFNQNEEFFLKLTKDFIVPHLPVHHDINQKTPEPMYLATIKDLITQLITLVPSLFNEMIYIFDPADIHKLKFIKLYRIQESKYLYFLKIDLLYKTHYHEIIKRGNNDLTPQYKTPCLFLEANFIPIDKAITVNGTLTYFQIKQTISETWIGEKGRGYLLEGIWMDDDLTKFFSKLFLPGDKKIYPYYPFACKYKTICFNIINFSPPRRNLELPFLHRALSFLTPNMHSIEQALKKESFSEQLSIFQNLKKKIPESWKSIWQDIQIKAYLNANNLKEYAIET